MKKTAVLVLLLLIVVMRCGKPVNPYEDPANVSMSVTAKAAADSCFILGDTLQVIVLFSLPTLVESLTVEIGNWDTCYFPGSSDSLRLLRPLLDTGSVTATFAAILEEGRRDTSFVICVVDTSSGVDTTTDTSDTTTQVQNTVPVFTMVSSGAALKVGGSDTLYFRAIDDDVSVQDVEYGKLKKQLIATKQRL